MNPDDGNIQKFFKKRASDQVIRSDDEEEGNDIRKKVLLNESNWIVDSNKALFLRLESDPNNFGSKEYVFNPEYTNQVFNEDENIKGYLDLEINVHILGGSLHAHLDINYKKQAPDADSLDGLNEIFIAGFLSRKEFEDKLAIENKFIPLGEKVAYYEKMEDPNSVFEIYHCNFKTPGFIEYNKRLQVFLPFYIDGGNFVENTDFWDYYILYQKNKNGIYILCGFCTTYSFYIRFNKKRIRVSQFIVLPPFQRKQHGTSLLNHVYEVIQKDEDCIELTVEDPSDDFQSLRDILDVNYVVKNRFMDWAVKFHKNPPELQEFKNMILSQKEIENIKIKLKLTKNQIERVFEILKLAIGKMDNEEFVVFYKNKIKERLYKANKTNFLPFLKKKYPILYIENERLKPNIEEFTKENKPEDEVEETLNEYWRILFDQYNKILKRVDKILETQALSVKDI